MRLLDVIRRLSGIEKKLIIAVLVGVRGYKYIFVQNKKDLKTSLFTAPCRPIGDVG